MTQPAPTPLFTPTHAATYDERNQKLAPIAENMHFLIRLVLQNLPAQARILCIGVGTGAEIMSLAQAFPQWTFVGADPSAAMLEVCAARLQAAGYTDRCELIHGYVEDVAAGEHFDAALSILVAHFVKREDRPTFFQNMTSRLKNGGYLVNTEISYDLNAPEFPQMLENWKQVQALMGATPESLATLSTTLREGLTILPNAETETHLRQSGFKAPIRFFQAFLITGWYSIKP